MPTKGTGVLAARVKDETILEVNRKAANRKMSLNAWLNWAISLGLRVHRRKAG